jgi:fermentation-respiration switch protein FrsA (DUF1100 family)
MGRALYEASAGTKSFWPVAGAGHNDIVETAGAAYRERLSAFYKSIHVDGTP